MKIPHLKVQVGVRVYYCDKKIWGHETDTYYLTIENSNGEVTQFGKPMFNKKEVENALKLLGIDPIDVL